ncbi:hypothetical protein HF521_004239 [Silurus meridionalis]|uniref:F-BAR domain-containing protein n=1 Tax=Silurus meridionalis TaxID=175797 RepID=A0A8T0AW26_SILME|nr:hypothetical protein HF521_004239 [Silurus meridionalis]
MSSVHKENGPEDAAQQSFWMPGNYQQTVKRTEDAFQACNDIVTCFQERARVERLYAQQLNEWSNKWKPLVDTSPLYGSLLRAWQCFLSSADRLSALHSSICRSLVSEDGDRIRMWQKETFHKKMFGGFRESQDFETGFVRAQKPWAKRLKKLEKAKAAFHKASRKEHTAREREAHAQGNPDITIEKQRKIQDERENAQRETQKVRASVKTVYNELHDALMAINDQEDLRWWKNTYGPGMPTDWPQFQPVPSILLHPSIHPSVPPSQAMVDIPPNQSQKRLPGRVMAYHRN